MRVIDGMHRLRAAKCRGQTEIAVQFFDGTEQDALVLAVQANIAHGLPLSLAERKAAAARIVLSHEQWSDRKIASVTGLAPSTVGAIRSCSTGTDRHANTRIGRDGKERRLDTATGRAQVIKLMEEKPNAPIREIARLAGVAPSTAQDVRSRLRDGKDPVPTGKRAAGRSPRYSSPPSLERVKQDPALRYNEAGRILLRLLHAQVFLQQASTRLVSAVPAHSAKAIAELAHRAADTWRDFANQLERRHDGNS
jgi:ParB-like chromosome segregation protein Spo0J